MPSPSSAGCRTCKLRRIKCDGAKPTCQKCAKTQRVCLDTNPLKPVCFSIHLENPYASGETKRPRGPRARSSLTLFHPTLDISSRAVTYFLNYYLSELIGLPTVSACMSECLTAWKISGRKCHMADLAISSLALAIFSRTQHHDLAARDAVREYSRLLRVAREKITQVEIRRCDEEGFDEFLLVVVLMAWYETSMHQPPHIKQTTLPSSVHSWSHHDGAMAILKAWNDNPRDGTPSSIIQHSRRGLLRSALLRHLSIPNWVQDGSRFGECGLDFGFDSILVRVINLRHSFKNIEKRASQEIAEVEYLQKEARELDEAVRDWAVQLPHEWSFESHSIPSSWPRSDFYYSVVYTCEKHGYAAVWIQYFAVRMLVNGTLISLLKMRHPNHLKTRDFTSEYESQKYVTQLKAMADSLAATAPFSLGRFAADKTKAARSRSRLVLNNEEEIVPALALPTVWPLTMASTLDGVELEQQLWFQAQLKRLGRVLGDGALECAGTDEWAHD